MKMKSLMAMAAMAFVFGLSSCGGDDDVPETPAANQVAGYYAGTETLTVDGEADESDEVIQITKVTDTTVDLVLPFYGEGMMTIPELPVKNIVVAKKGDDISGTITGGTYTGTVTNSKGEEKTYTVNDFVLLYNETNKTLILTFKMKYGNMPFVFEGLFVGEKSLK